MKTARPCRSLVVVVVLLLCAVSAWARGTAKVSNTVHNLSSSAPYVQYKSNESEICIFCHTPHGGLLEGPLWNRSLPGNTPNYWTHYNSATLSTEAKVGGISRDVNDESLLCMSCHDGSISTMHLLNPSNTTGQPVQGGWNTEVPIPPFGTIPGAKIGATLADITEFGNLSDDHPISFSYKQVYDNNYAPGKPKAGQLQDYTIASTTGYKGDNEAVRFFGTGYNMECSSCHDPHVDYETDARYDPFLIRPNSGSSLCLTCHVK